MLRPARELEDQTLHGCSGRIPGEARLHRAPEAGGDSIRKFPVSRYRGLGGALRGCLL